IERSCGTSIAPKSAQGEERKGDRWKRGEQVANAGLREVPATAGKRVVIGPSAALGAGTYRRARKNCVAYHAGYYHRGIERRSEFQRGAVENYPGGKGGGGSAKW